MSSTVTAASDIAVASITGDDYDWRLAADVAVAREIRVSRCRLDAQQLRLYASAYATAERRAERSKLAPNDRVILSVDGDAFAWQLRSIMGEFAVATRTSDIALCNRAYDAHELVTEFPAWVAAIEAAVVELAHADAMLRKQNGVPRDRLGEYGERVLEYATSHTAGQTRGYAAKVAAELAADEFEEAHERERAQRCVYVEHEPLGMSWIHAYLPTEQAVPIVQLLTDQARILKEDARNERIAAAEAARLAGRDARLAAREANRDANAGTVYAIAARDETSAEGGDGAAERGEAAPGDGDATGGRGDAIEFVPDERTMDQLRADLFADTLLTATPEQILNSPTQGAPRVLTTVSVTIPVTSLLEAETGVREGVRRNPALLNGLQPISTTEALQIASEAPTFYRILTDPITGHVLTVDDRQANAQLRRVLKVRDKTCRFPGCIKPAQDCELDHTQAYSEGGPSSQWNLAHLCKGHHVQKHHRGWRVKQLAGGVLEWTSPLGQVVSTVPERLGPVFRPSEPPDATPGENNDDPPPF